MWKLNYKNTKLLIFFTVEVTKKKMLIIKYFQNILNKISQYMETWFGHKKVHTQNQDLLY